MANRSFVPSDDVLARTVGVEVVFIQLSTEKYLGMSGKEFVRKYRAGEIEDPGRSDVVALSMLLPFADE